MLIPSLPHLFFLLGAGAAGWRCPRRPRRQHPPQRRLTLALRNLRSSSLAHGQTVVCVCSQQRPTSLRSACGRQPAVRQQGVRQQSQLQHAACRVQAQMTTPSAWMELRRSSRGSRAAAMQLQQRAMWLWRLLMTAMRVRAEMGVAKLLHRLYSMRGC